MFGVCFSSCNWMKGAGMFGRILIKLLMNTLSYFFLDVLTIRYTVYVLYHLMTPRN
jgi:hypothetical protein